MEEEKEEVKPDPDPAKPSTSQESEDEEAEPMFPVFGKAHGVKNKFLRQKIIRHARSERVKANIEKARERFRAKKAWIKSGNKGEPPKEDTGPKKVPHTLESLREPDLTYVEKDDEELEFDESIDKYAKYYEKSYEPQVLITTSDNPHTKTIAFQKELSLMIPGAKRYWRKRSSIKKMIKSATARGFTDIVVINEDRRMPNGLLVIHLPEGPSALFRLSNPRRCKDIKRKRSEITDHRPEVILNNFKTRLGQMIARMLGALFHYEPEFRGRRVCTFHNQRDYIFFRHHRYEFESSEKVNLRELGPRFTLKLQWLQDGAFDGDYEWLLKRHEMETSRRRFFL